MAAKAVQTHVGVVADGDIGPQSLAAIAGRPDQIFILCAALADAQLAYYRSLEAWPLYGRGWSNRVSARLTAALQLAA
jgi:lysozyme family protein